MSGDLTCHYCGETFTRRSEKGPIPKFCSDAHRQRAYELRSMTTAIRDLTVERDGWRMEAKKYKKGLADALTEGDQLRAIIRRCSNCYEVFYGIKGTEEGT